MTRRVLVLVAALTAAACGGREPAARPDPEPVDPVGSYDFVATRGSDSRPGTLDIHRTASGLGAEARLVGEPFAAIADSITIYGSRVRIYTLIGGGDPVDFDLDFEGGSFRGVIIAATDTIDVIGQRRE